MLLNASWRRLVGLAGLVGSLAAGGAAPAGAKAIDCSAVVPATLLNDSLAELSGQSCENVKNAYARALSDQAALLLRLRPVYQHALTAPPSPAPAASEVQAALKAYDADLARLTAMAGTIAERRLAAPPAAKPKASAASAAAGPPLADLLRESGRLAKDLSDRAMKDAQGLKPAEVDAYCRLQHHQQFGRTVHGRLVADCPSAD